MAPIYRLEPSARRDRQIKIRMEPLYEGQGLLRNNPKRHTMKYPNLDALETFEDTFHMDTLDFDEGANDPWGDDKLEEEEDDDDG